MITLLLLLQTLLPSPSPALDYTPTTPGASVMQQATLPTPAAPALLSIQRHSTHATLTWECTPDAIVFQIARRTSTNDVPFVQRVERHHTRQSFTVSRPTVVRFEWVDKRLEREPTYYYTVVAITPVDATAPSNMLSIAP